jgi:2-oxo-4-hydroxy-4-carboxy-5-ureidoimidazoline decarboxylase
LGSIEDFNALPEERASRQLYGCLASRRWVEQVVSGRPYRDADALLLVVDIAMGQLTDEEWLEAMAVHPRIGERGGDAPGSSELEQKRAMQGSPATLSALAAENRQYEERFGHVFLIAASGRSAEEILSELRRRIGIEPAAELMEAKRQLRKITLLRLEKLLYP